MKMLIKFTRLKALSIITKLLKEYVVIKYGSKSDICVVTGGPEKTLSFQTSQVDGLIPVEQARRIRQLVGQNVLTVCGLPTEEETPPNIVLVLTPSAIKVLGYTTAYFIKEWPGDSKVGEITAVTYSLK